MTDGQTRTHIPHNGGEALVRVALDDPAGVPWQEASLALGVFDGVHRGHQAVISGMVRAARSEGRHAVVVTFDPHPTEVVGDGAPPHLTTVRRRARLMRTLGADAVAILRFDRELSQLSPADFSREILAGQLRGRGVFIGFDFRFGRGGRGDGQTLTDHGRRFGFEVRVQPPVKCDGDTISSTAIRRQVDAGEVRQAARRLGRPHRVSGRVVRGEGRGREVLGIPTANLAVPDEMAVPGTGVYAVRTAVEDEEAEGRPVHAGVANIGYRPTFDGGDRELTVEVHLLDVDRELYGRRLAVDFVEHLRAEREFDGVDDLRRGIQQDIAAARRILSE